MTSQEENPVVQQRRLRAELRRLRDDNRLVQKEVAEALQWSVSKLIRIETGAVSISRSDLIALLHHYGVKDQQRIDELIEIARISRQSAWWDKYRDQFGPQFITFIGYEASATVLRKFQYRLVPGLLQTKEYAEAVITAYNETPERIKKGVQVRLERQQLMEPGNKSEYFFVLDEAVLRRWVGGPAVMRKQLERLKEMNQRPNISIQIARFEIGAYVGVKGAFTVYELPYSDQDYAVLLEYADRDVLLQNAPDETASFVDSFQELERVAAPSTETDKIIDEIIATMPDSDPKGTSDAKP